MKNLIQMRIMRTVQQLESNEEEYYESIDTENRAESSIINVHRLSNVHRPMLIF